MTELEKLEAQREKVRVKEKALTKEIVAARQLERQGNKANIKTPCLECRVKAKEVTELKAIIAISEKANGEPLEAIGFMLGVSSNRVRQIIAHRKRVFLGILQEIRTVKEPYNPPQGLHYFTGRASEMGYGALETLEPGTPVFYTFDDKTRNDKVLVGRFVSPKYAKEVAEFYNEKYVSDKNEEN